MEEIEEVVAQKKELSNKPNMPEKLVNIMQKQGYHFVGRHSAIKTCNYTSESMKKDGKSCYKHQFYGIESHRCMQSTPVMGCNLSCVFCWRVIPDEIGIKWNELNAMGNWDDPNSIVDGLIFEQRRLVSGFKGNKDVDMNRWKEAQDPAHVALSLTGEPLFYPLMSKLLQAFHDRKISTFLVTNGTMANALKALTVLPTQLYVSIQAPNKETYEKTVRAKTLNAWEKFQEFLGIFATLNTRRVFRLTLVKNVNINDLKGYADLIIKGDPHYVEVKGFVFVGGARTPARKLEYEQMPTKEEIIDFATQIAKESGYTFVDYHESSKVALLSKNAEVANRRLIHFEKI